MCGGGRGESLSGKSCLMSFPGRISNHLFIHHTPLMIYYYIIYRSLCTPTSIHSTALRSILLLLSQTLPAALDYCARRELAPTAGKNRG